MVSRILAQVLTAIYTGFNCTLFALLWFDPRFWLRSRLNPYSHETPVLKGLGLLAYRLDILYMAFCQKPLLALRSYWKKKLIKPRSPQTFAIEWNWQERGPMELQRELIKNKRPVVLRQFLKAKTTDYFAWEKFLKEYGDAPVKLTCPLYDGYDGSLKEVEREGVYMQNGESLIANSPDLIEKTGLSEIAQQWIPKSFRFALGQLFVGGKNNTGSPYHCAGEYNVFMMLHGKKKWTFIDPEFSPLLLPTRVSPTHSYFGHGYSPDTLHSPVSHYQYVKQTDECREHTKKVYSHEALDPELDDKIRAIPKITVTLEPGDVLINAPFWWHEVENIVDQTIACASRWSDGYGFRGNLTNPLFAGVILTRPAVMAKSIRSLVNRQLKREAYDTRCQRQTPGLIPGEVYVQAFNRADLSNSQSNASAYRS